MDGILAAGGGRALDDATRSFFEPRFGHDFSNVRVRSDEEAARAAQTLNARAFTFGSSIYFGAGEYQPATREGQRLLAHELTHVVQQGTASQSSSIQRQVGPPTSPAPCDTTHTADIDTALGTARDWRRQASAWLDAYLTHLRRRTPRDATSYAPVGTAVFSDLERLDQHFRISDVIRANRSSFPSSATDPVNVQDLENFGNATYWIRRRFGEVDLSGLVFQCQAPCPTGRTGTDVLGSAVAGSREVTIYTDCFDRQQPHTKAGVVLHEAFHASFPEFSGDAYSFEGRYPGPTPLTNAESFATFAAVVATGHTYRIVVMPATTITGSRSP